MIKEFTTDMIGGVKLDVDGFNELYEFIPDKPQ